VTSLVKTLKLPINFMKLKSSLIFICLFIFSLITASTGFAKLNIVTTTTDIAAITKAVAGDLADVQSITKGNQDPHFIQAKPSHMVKLNRADLLIYQGLELEVGWLPSLIKGARNPKILPNAPGHLDLSSVIKPIEVHQGEVDRSMGDVHPLGNPHYTLDPKNGFLMAMAIADILGKLDPRNEATYQGNMFRFTSELRKKIEEWSVRLNNIQNKKVVTYHQTWNYLLQQFGIEQVAVVELIPGVPPTPKHLLDLAEIMKKQRVRTILHANFYEAKFSKLLAEKTSARVFGLPASVGGTPEAKDYIALFEVLVTQLEKAFPKYHIQPSKK
jgi:ABC-type Zn uptake system ZnuABC Zn-binding protein ZnuA